MPRYKARQGFTCPITGKIGYPTYQAAEKRRRWLKSHDADGVKNRTQLETYGPCDCGQYHHTSSKPLGLVPSYVT